MAENVALGHGKPAADARTGGTNPGGIGGIRPAAGPVAHGRRSVGGRTPAGRDHPLPAARPQAADHGRTDQRADAARGGDPVQDPAATCRPRARRSCISATSWRKSASLCDEATILRRGKVVATCTPRERSAREMAELMVGATLTPPAPQRKAEGRGGAGGDGAVRRLAHSLWHIAERRQFRRATGRGSGHRRGGGQRAGRIAAGAVGRVEIRARRGADRWRADGRHGAERAARGWVWWPHPKNGWAMPPPPTCALVENALLSGALRKGLVKNGFIDWARPRTYADEIVKDFDVRTPGTMVAARALSGGNLQKFVIGREILQDPDGDRDQPADLGGGCRSGGLDPAGDPGPGGRRGGGGGASARIWMNCWKLPTALPR